MSRRGFRLSRPGEGWLRSSEAPAGFLEFAGWLAPDVLWVDGWLTSAPSERLPVAVIEASERREIEAPRFCYSRPDLGDLPGAAGQIVVLPAPELVGDPPSLEALEVRHLDSWYRWTMRRGLGIQPDLVTRCNQKLETFAPEVVRELYDFLIACGELFGVEAGSSALADRNLSAVRRFLPPEPEAPPLELEPEPEELVEGPETEELIAEVEELEERGEESDLEVIEGEDAPVLEDGDSEEASGSEDEAEEPEKLEEPDGGESVESEEPEESESEEGELESEDAEGEPEDAEGAEPEPEPELEIRFDHLAAYQAEPSRPLGLSLDRLIAIDDETVFVRGWLWDLEGAAEGLDLVTPSGERTEILPGLPRVWRRQVTEIFRPEFGAFAEGRHGFLGLVRVEDPIPGHLGYGFELRLRSREPLRAGPPVCITDSFQGRDALFQALPDENQVDLWLLREQLHPALEVLQHRCRGLARVVHSFAFGDVPQQVDVSVVIPLWQRLDLLEHQVLQLAAESAMRDGELILVLDRPELAVDFERSAHALSRLYGTRIRGLVCERSVGYAAATELGARQARGRLLLLMHSDVIGGVPGWLEAMVQFHDSKDSIGVVGPKLLFEDDSLQHAGLEIRDDLEPDRLCSVEPRLQGLPRRAPGGEVPTQVSAVSDACLLISHALYDEVGGMVDVYVAGDLENVDLCLRSARLGRETWYLPAAELYHLEGQSRRPATGWNRNRWSQLYNRWLLTERRVGYSSHG